MARKVRKMAGVILLMTAVLLTQLPVIENEAAATSDFQMNKDTLVKYTGTGSTVSVSDSVKEIGEEAFSGNKGLNRISIGKNVTKIKVGAFGECTYLSEFSMSDSVEEIGNSVFSGCSNLTKINIGKSLVSLGKGVFAGCDSLKSISISKDNSNFKFEKGALYNQDKTVLYAYLSGNKDTSFQMPDSVETISEYAFWGNDTLESIKLSSSLKEISGYSFSNCKNLQSITIPYAVRTIDAKAFENCVSLKDVDIPNAVTFIHSSAFDGCSKIEIKAQEGSYAAEFAKTLPKTDVSKVEAADTVDAGDTVVVSSKNGVKEESTQTEGGDETDESASATNETEQTVNETGINAKKDPSNVEYMPDHDVLSDQESEDVLAKSIVVNQKAVLFLDSKNITINQGILEQNEENETGTEEGSQADVVLYDPQKGGNLPKYAIKGNNIANQGYYGDLELTQIDIPNTIQKIGEFSFARSGLSQVVIPDSVTDILYGAFYHCDALKNVVIPDSVTNIEACAFEKTPWLTEWKSRVEDSPYLIVGDNILLAYKGNDKNIEIPEGVKMIAPQCFLGHSEIQTVYLPDSLKNIAEESFSGCTSLTTVTGGNYIEKIGDRAFTGCPVTTFVIPGTVKNMGLKAIDYTNTGKSDNSKTVVFSGNTLPVITPGKLSMRLLNDSYREDVLYNVLFAVVSEDCTQYSDTVLDSEKLGFSGMIVSIEKDNSGKETGYVTVRENAIFSQTILDHLDGTVLIQGKTYQIKDFSSIQTASHDSSQDSPVKELKVLYNQETDSNIHAEFSENEKVGTLLIEDSQEAEQKIASEYKELFSEEPPIMAGLSITLKDVTGSVPLTQFGKATLTITMPLPTNINGSTYHVVCLDSDGQLEELNARKEDSTITFETSHLSDFAIYATGDESVSLHVKDGKVIRNLKKDDSPNTGDYSIPVKYPLALGIACIALILFFWKGKKRV